MFNLISSRLLGLIILNILVVNIFGVAFIVGTSLPYGATIEIMPLGDSITAGIPGSAGYRERLYWDLTNSGYDVDFVGSLSDGFAFDADHEGHSGKTAFWLNSRLNGPTDYFLSANPDVILYHIGTNDLDGSDIA
ncbi:MAG: hypothetical protein JSW72_09605, partial [Candidatus Bathyarchaeota archaeon]